MSLMAYRGRGIQHDDARLELTRDQILAHRRSVGALEERLPPARVPAMRDLGGPAGQRAAAAVLLSMPRQRDRT